MMLKTGPKLDGCRCPDQYTHAVMNDQITQSSGDRTLESASSRDTCETVITAGLDRMTVSEAMEAKSCSVL